MMEYASVKLPIRLAEQIDEYIQKHPHEGYTTRVEVIRLALREFLKNNGGGSNSIENTAIPSPLKNNGDEKRDV